MTIIDKVCEGITQIIADAEIDGMTAIPVVDYAPELDFAKVKTQTIIVSPTALTRSNLNRGLTGNTAKVSVFFAERIDPAMAKDKLIIMEQITKVLQRQRLEHNGYLFATIVETQIEPLYAAELLQNNRVYFSVIQATVKVLAD